MYKLMVVDDEINIRKGIINAIQWEALGLELAGEAGDGNEALSMIAVHMPDIVLMDMRMPGMDGIGLIHALKEQYPLIRFIIISAYSDFDYTREAIVNKAFDYLLKPIKKDELNRILSNCINELEKDNALFVSKNITTNAANTVESLIPGFILGTQNDSGIVEKCIEYLKSLFSFPGVYCCVIKIDSIYFARKLLDKSDVLDIAKGDIEGFFTGYGRVFMFLNRQINEIVALFCPPSYDKKIAAFLGEMTNGLKKLRGFTISIGIGEMAKTPDGLHSSYKQASRAVTLKNIKSSSQVIIYNKNQNDKKTESVTPSYNGELILNTIKGGNTEKSLDLLDKLVGDMAAGNFTVHSLHKNMVILLGDIDKELYNNGTSIEIECGRSSLQIVNDIIGAYSPEEVGDVFRPVVSKISLFFYMRNKKGGKKIVDEIIKNIQLDYSKQISLYGYAKQYYLNPDYLGRVFKNETGKSFVDFLTEVRIKRAMELIKDELCVHYYEVASSVGYDDYSYFCKVFKLVTGQTPGEFKDSVTSQK